VKTTFEVMQIMSAVVLNSALSSVEGASVARGDYDQHPRDYLQSVIFTNTTINAT